MEETLTALPVGTFLDRLAAREPTPGGGAVAGVAGALSCALGRMVAAYSIGKKTGDRDREAIEDWSKRLCRTEGVLRCLVEDDARAYAAYSALPKDADEKEKARALERAMTVPLGICAAVRDALEVFKSLAPKAGRYMLSDLEAAAILAEATVRCAGCSVRVNAAMLADRARADNVLADLNRIAQASAGALDAVTQALRGRVESAT